MYKLQHFNIPKIEKSPYLDMFDVFNEMNLQGLTIAQALQAAVIKSKEVYKKVENKTDTKAIRAYKYDEGHLIEATVDETKLVDTINKSLREFSYDDALLNAQQLVIFYKTAYYEAQAYKFFYDYMMKLFTRFTEINELLKDGEKTRFQMKELSDENIRLHKEFEIATQESLLTKKKLEKYKRNFSNFVANEKILKFFLDHANKMTIKNELNVSAMQIVGMILYQGRLEIKEICSMFGATKKELMSMVEAHSDMFVIIDNQYLDLNFHHAKLKKNAMVKEIEKVIEDLGLDKIEIVEEQKSVEVQEDEQESIGRKE